MPQKKEYRNARRSRMCIRAAFVALLNEKPFEKITATDIIRKSGVNRSTFYAHYPDAKGIMDEITGEVLTLFQSTLKQMDFRSFFHDPMPFLTQMLDFLRENEELYRLLGKSEQSLNYLEKLKNVLVREVLSTPGIPLKDADPVKTHISLQLLLGGVIDTYRQWLAGEIDCSLEEMTEEVAKIVILCGNFSEPE